MQHKIIRTATIPKSLDTFCRGLFAELAEEYEVVALSSPGEELQAIARREGIRTLAVPMERHISMIKDVQSLLKLIRVFGREKPDMVHSMTPKAGLLCMLAARITRVPVRVHTFTGLVFPTSTGWRRKVLMLTDRLTCACATHLIPEGEGVKNDLLRFNITRKPMQVLGYGNVRGIDLTYYDRTPEVRKEAAEIRQSLGIDKESFVFAFVGRLVGDKGINELIAAFDRLGRQSGNVHLLLVGSEEPALDPLKAETRETIRWNPRIHAVGNQADVRPWYAAADALTFPSYREGFPNVVIEAGAMGLPSIVTDINGSREIISDGVNGIVIPPREEEALYQAMKSLAEQPEQAKALAQHARSIVADRYEQGFVRRCLKEFYRNVLQERRKTDA